MKNSIRSGMLRAIAAAAALFIAPTVSAHTQQAGDLQIIHPWATPGSVESRAHPTLVNDGEDAIDIVGATTPAARTARLRLEDVLVTSLSVPPGVTLTPDELVIEFGQLAAPLAEGAHFPLTLELADGGVITFHVVVGETPTMLEMQ
jgi:copper(I)-binding protein